MSKIPDEFKMELFGVDMDLRTILGNVDCDVRACDSPLTQAENTKFIQHIQAACKIAITGLHRKMASSDRDSKDNLEGQELD